MFLAVPLPETCRGSFFSQNKFGKLVHLLVLLLRNLTWTVFCVVWERKMKRSFKYRTASTIDFKEFSMFKIQVYQFFISCLTINGSLWNVNLLLRGGEIL